MLQYVTDKDWDMILNNTERPKQNRSVNMLGLIGTLAGAAASIGSSIYNVWSQKQINKQNQEYNNYVLQNRLQMSADDAKKAGFSPLAALGISQPTSGAASSAPQLDMSTLANLLASAGSLDIERAKLAESKRQFNMTHPNLHDEFGETMEETKRGNDILQQQADAATKNADTNAQNADTNARNSMNQALQFWVHEGNLVDQFNDNLKLQRDIFENDRDFKKDSIKKEFTLQLQESTQRQYESLCHSLGVAPQVEYVSDWDEYLRKSKASQAIYKEFLQNYNRAMEKTGLTNVSTSDSESDSWQAGANAAKGSSGRKGTSDSLTNSSTTSGKVGKNSSVNDTISSVANSIQETINPSFSGGVDFGSSKSKSNASTKNEYYLKTTLAYELEHSGYKFYVYAPKGVD